MRNNVETKTNLGWWLPAVLLLVLTAAEWSAAFVLVSKVSSLATSWQWTPAGAYDVVGR